MAKISKIIKKDYSSLANFLAKRMENSFFWNERFNIWWKDNPAYKEGKEGWVLKEKGKIVGCTLSIPTKFQLGAKEVYALNGTSWVVLPHYRSQGMHLFFKQLMAEPIAFFTTPGKKGAKSFEKVGAFLMPRNKKKQKYFRKSVIIFNLGNLINLELSTRINNSFFKKVFKTIETLLQVKKKNSYINEQFIKLMNFLSNLYCSFRFKRMNNQDTKNVKQIYKAGSIFDKLWEKTRNIYENTNVRTSEVINWYLKDPLRKRILFGFFEKNELLGYILFNQKPNERILECVDIWYDLKKPDVLASLIAFSLKYSKKTNKNALIFPHFSGSIGESLCQLGLSKIVFGKRRDFYILRHQPKKKINYKNSYFVELQGDYAIW